MKCRWLGWIGTLVLAGTARAAEKPMNVVFLLVDDLGWADVSPTNPETFYRTPNIKALADSGVTFTQAYAACPVCSPTRSSILTGQYPARTRNTDYFGAPGQFFGQELPAEAVENRNWQKKKPLISAPYLGQIPESQTTLAEAFKAQGYSTFFTGKWHLGPKGAFPTDQGFDINIGGHRAGGPYSGKKYFSPYKNPMMDDGPEGEHLPDRLASETVKFIQSNKERPFFAYLSFYSVHTPLMGRKDLVAKYQEAREKSPTPKDKLWKTEHPRRARQVQEHAVYAAMVEAMDLAVGKVLRGIEEAGVAENTIVVFFSDNGGLSTSEGSPTSNLPLRGGKGWLYEGGIREPLIVRWPGLGKSGATCATPVISTDFYPTLLEMAGHEPLPEQHVDGVDFSKLVSDPSSKHERPALFWHYPHWGNQGGIPGSVVREGDWKYIEYYWGKEPELYNLSEDVGERKNRASECSEQVKRLKGLLDGYREQTKALEPIPGENFDKKLEEVKW